MFSANQVCCGSDRSKGCHASRPQTHHLKCTVHGVRQPGPCRKVFASYLKKFSAHKVAQKCVSETRLVNHQVKSHWISRCFCVQTTSFCLVKVFHFSDNLIKSLTSEAPFIMCKRHQSMATSSGTLLGKLGQNLIQDQAAVGELIDCGTRSKVMACLRLAHFRCRLRKRSWKNPAGIFTNDQMLEDLFKESTTNVDILLEVLDEGNNVITVVIMIIFISIALCIIVFLIATVTSRLLRHHHHHHINQVHCHQLCNHLHCHQHLCYCLGHCVLQLRYQPPNHLLVI